RRPSRAVRDDEKRDAAPRCQREDDGRKKARGRVPRAAPGDARGELLGQGAAGHIDPLGGREAALTRASERPIAHGGTTRSDPLVVGGKSPEARSAPDSLRSALANGRYRPA